MISRHAVSPAAPGGPNERELIRALPWSLAHATLNSVFAMWTFGGSVFLLYLSELGLPAQQIGIVLSLFPFCGLLALAFASHATRRGRKRVFIACYGARKITMAGLLFVPVVLEVWGRNAAVAYLVVVISLFAILRALAETAYYPWAQEFVPNRVRGQYSAAGAILGALASAAALMVAGRVIGQAGAGLTRFLVLQGVGCVIGLVGVAMMMRVPGGAPVGDPGGAAGRPESLRHALRDANFLAYLGGLGATTVAAMVLISFLPLYVRDGMSLPAGAVVSLDAVTMVGGIASSFLWGWASDRFGSRPVLMPALALSVVVALGWLCLPRGVPHAMFWCGLLYFLNGAAASGMALASSRLLYNGVVAPDRSTSYTAVFYAWSGLTGGAAPLLAGALLNARGRAPGPAEAGNGYVQLFALSALLFCVGWVLYARVRPDDRYTTRGVLRRLAAAIQWRLFTGRAEQP